VAALEGRQPVIDCSIAERLGFPIGKRMGLIHVWLYWILLEGRLEIYGW